MSWAEIKSTLPKRSLFVFSLDNPIRKGLIYTVRSMHFGRFILFLILANCVLLAMDTKEPGFEKTATGQVVGYSEYLFTALFALEMCLKIIALGFVGHPGAYLADNWNRMDFCVVLLGLLAYLPFVDNFSAIRSARVLRPLRTITNVKGMRVIVGTLLGALPKLFDVFVLVFFLFFIYGVVGVQLFMGKMDQKCATLASEYPNHGDSNTGTSCDAGSYCIEETNKDNLPNFGLTTFNHIGWAWLTIFQSISMEGWTTIMYRVMDAVSRWAWVYFVSLIIIGSFFAVNLALAVLYVQFTSEADIESLHPDKDKDKKGDAVEYDEFVPIKSGNRIVRACYAISISPRFEQLTIALICVNTVVMASEHNGMPSTMSTVNDWINYTLYGYFVIEMLIKLTGFGWRRYVADRMNVFDAFVVFVSTIEIVISLASGNDPDGYLTVLRTFRLLRIFKLARSWKALNVIITTMFNSIASISFLSLILMLFMFIFALLGMQVYGYEFVNCDKSDYSRHNFDNIYWSFITIFQMLTGENWNEVMYDGMRQVSAWASVYFIGIVVLGNYIILNLFLAILLDNFAEEAENNDDDDDDDDDDGGKPKSSQILEPHAFVHGKYVEGLEHTSLYIFGPRNAFRKKLAQFVYHPYFEYAIIFIIACSSIALAIDGPKMSKDAPLYDTELSDSEEQMKSMLYYADLTFTAIFTLELIMKVMVDGFIAHKGSYLRSPWNILDALVVVVGILAVVGDDSMNASSLRALRTFRALRPIRMASRAQGVKVVVNALFQAIPGIGNVALVCMLFYLIFGIMGLNIFMGKMYYCSDETDTATRLYGSTTEFTTLGSPYTITSVCSPTAYTTLWTNPRDYNFDHIGNSILALFETATLENWLFIMYHGVDTTSLDHQPVRDASPYLALFFVVFIIVGSFFVMNLFVGVTIDKFNEMKEKQEGFKGSILLTESQKKWVAIQKLLVACKPDRVPRRPSHSKGRASVYDFVVSDKFEVIVMVSIMQNIVVMALAHDGMNDTWVSTLFYINCAFAVMFLLEATAKIYAYNPKEYFSDNWNRFDFFVVVISIGGVVITLFAGQDAAYVSMIRIFRVARIFRLIPKAKSLRTLFQTLLYSMPALVNVGSVLALFFFIFAVMGMNLFGKIVPTDGELSRYAKFEDFPTAVLTLFRMSTGEAWNGIMHDCMITDNTYKSADEDNWTDRCTPSYVGTVFYFSVFILLCAFVLLNLVIAVILDNFASNNEDEENPVSKEHMYSFTRAWVKLDPHATYYTRAANLEQIVQTIEPPLGCQGVPPNVAKQETQKIIMSVDIPNHDGKIHFLETLHALAGRIAGTELPAHAEVKVTNKIQKQLPTLRSGKVPQYTAAHYYAAMYVQAAVRGFLARYEMREKMKTMPVNKLARQGSMSKHSHASSG
ncbi:voltage-gated ion channel superfamily [Micromonas pusilla CCMP1545]|uniref:Voltage-gated ion channel superfamily n=1 Tax=Micromonas pusilla (strain CCMP1545) TaxID=564608 RepID=C1MLS9_MICPC|nr:voltage-gated ion channel superfamily [Micromonas pusilla CCMP1545]EEH58460.1 voltage-gated ion channel superfamily [Micromonas pusilla CCMP1545]|eukprot:XP_003056815.1 voltage-gated ion channel superfamily [Micromonas pusilla CCMP1545]